jgi:hypothetical protein
MATRQFQQFWISLLHEESDDSFDIKLQQFVDDGADINFPFESEDFWEPHTPLYYLLASDCSLSRRDELLRFLLYNGVVPTEADIKRSIRQPKVLEQILYLAREEDIHLYNYHNKPLCLEVLLGFPSVTLDQESPYELTYSVDKAGIYYRIFNCLPIEQCLMDYARDFGSAVTTTEERQEVLRIMKKNGTPYPRIGLLKEMLDLVNDEEVRTRFREAYEYWKSL